MAGRGSVCRRRVPRMLQSSCRVDRCPNGPVVSGLLRRHDQRAGRTRRRKFSSGYSRREVGERRPDRGNRCRDDGNVFAGGRGAALQQCQFGIDFIRFDTTDRRRENTCPACEFGLGPAQFGSPSPSHRRFTQCHEMSVSAQRLIDERCASETLRSSNGRCRTRRGCDGNGRVTGGAFDDVPVECWDSIDSARFASQILAQSAKDRTVRTKTLGSR